MRSSACWRIGCDRLFIQDDRERTIGFPRRDQCGLSGRDHFDYALLVFAGRHGAAADIRLLSVGEVITLSAAGGGFQSRTPVTISCSPSLSRGPVAQRSRRRDLRRVIVYGTADDRLDNEGIVNPKAGCGWPLPARHRGARGALLRPNLATPRRRFKQALLAAKSVVSGDPTLPTSKRRKGVTEVLAKADSRRAEPKLRIVPGKRRARPIAKAR